jgi:hypothetical protein
MVPVLPTSAGDPPTCDCACVIFKTRKHEPPPNAQTLRRLAGQDRRSRQALQNGGKACGGAPVAERCSVMRTEMRLAATASPLGLQTQSRSLMDSLRARWVVSSQRAARRPRLWSARLRSRKQPSAARATIARTDETLHTSTRNRNRENPFLTSKTASRSASQGEL